MINYQGKITTLEGALIDTAISMQFYIYPTIGGPAGYLWAETLSTVVVEKGVFSVLLGSVNPIRNSVFSGETRYLELIIGDGSVMYPRKAIVSVGYAFRSAESDTSEYAHYATTDNDWNIDTSGFNVYRMTGNVGIGTAIPQARLEVAADFGHIDLVETDHSHKTWRLQANGGDFKLYEVSADNNRISVAENTGYVGIGTNGPDERLTVEGNAHITGDLTVDGSISAFPLKVFDSGWFACVLNTQYFMMHNLGTTKILVSVYFATDASGSNMELVGDYNLRDTGTSGCVVHSITSTSLQISSGSARVNHMGTNWGGSPPEYTSGYYRVIALALE